MLNSSWARSPTPGDVIVVGGVIIAAIASIAAAPATTPNPACQPSVVHFTAEPRPLSTKPIMRADWPILERLSPPYAEDAETPQPALIREALNSEPVSDVEDDAPRKHRRIHRH